MSEGSRRLVLVALVLVVGSLGAICVWRTPGSPATVSSVSPPERKPGGEGPQSVAENGRIKVETRSGREVILRDRQVERIVQKDAQGLAPLERVITAEGPVEIRRVFDASGKVVSEKAYRNGIEVPVPTNSRSSPGTTAAATPMGAK